MNIGTCWVNQHVQFGSSIPFGEAKHSVLVAENGIEGLKSYTQAHVVNVLKNRPSTLEVSDYASIQQRLGKPVFGR